MTDLSIGGETFRVEIEGDPSRPTLLLSNALGTVLSLWDAQMPALLQRFRVIRYDSRGHGGSVVGDGPYSIARLGQDVLAILDALEIERTHFIGMSMGGAVGQWLLVNAPHRIDRAVLANTAARIGTTKSWNARIASVRTGDLEGNATSAIERWFSPDFARRHPEVVGRCHEMLRHTPAEGYAASCAALRDMDLRHAIRAISNAVLVVTGADDPVTPPESVATLLSAMPHAKHVVLAARHVSAVEAASAFSKAVIDFLTSKATRKAATRREEDHRAAGRAPGSGARRVAGRSTGAVRRAVTRPAPTETTRTKRTATKTAPTVRATRTTKPVKASQTPAVARRGSKAAKSSVARGAVKASTTPRRRVKPLTNSAPVGKATTNQKPRVKTPAAKAKSPVATRAAVPSRRATPTSARSGKVLAPKTPPATKPKSTGVKITGRKPLVGKNPIGKGTTGKSIAAKRPAPRRKASAATRRPKGRGKP